MARKIKFTTFDTPGLFDDEDIELHNQSQIFSDIEKDAERLQKKRMGENPSIDNIFINKDSLSQPTFLKFMSFGSGSSGNCAYIGDDECGFLIDAGVDSDKVLASLKEQKIDIANIKGICLTHDHSDHIRYAYNIVRRNRHIPIFCTPRTLNGILCRHNISRRIKDYHRPIYKEMEFKIGKFTITAFDVSHDGHDNVGYFIKYGNHRFAIATDLGIITERVEYYMQQADYIMLESNYDRNMLINGDYREHLKARILANDGHLDNVEASQFIAKIYSEQLKYVFLCHLSQDNNTPDIALSQMRSALMEKGVFSIGDGSGDPISRQSAIQIIALPRFDSSPLYLLRKD